MKAKRKRKNETRGARRNGPGFATWQEVLDYARTGAPIQYQAPMDLRPTTLRARPAGAAARTFSYELRAKTIRIWPPGSVGRGRARTADPFTADRGHLSRFSRPDEVQANPKKRKRNASLIDRTSRRRKNAYPKWQARYSGESFDRAQAMAYKLTDADRKAGRPAPKVGYSEANFRKAEREVREAARRNSGKRRNGPAGQRKPLSARDRRILGYVANHQGLSKQERAAALRLGRRGYTDRRGTWKLTPAGKAAATDVLDKPLRNASLIERRKSKRRNAGGGHRKADYQVHVWRGNQLDELRSAPFLNFADANRWAMSYVTGNIRGVHAQVVSLSLNEVLAHYMTGPEGRAIVVNPDGKQVAEEVRAKRCKAKRGKAKKRCQKQAVAIGLRRAGVRPRGKYARVTSSGHVLAARNEAYAKAELAPGQHSLRAPEPIAWPRHVVMPRGVS